jgi:hypothetical protein
MNETPPTDAELDAAAEEAQGIWSNGTNDDVWRAVFRQGENVAAELLERIASDPAWTVGDLTHEQCLAQITRRYPYLVA